MSFISTPSLAAATSTRVDSACKHIQQCRVSYDHMLNFVGSSNELERDKMQYCVHKDEFAVGVSRPWVKTSTRTLTLSAYPRIISNLGKIASSGDEQSKWILKMMKYLYHFSTSLQKRAEIIDQMNPGPDQQHHQIPTTGVPAQIRPYFTKEDGTQMDLRPCIPRLFDFYSVGFANTLGYAHPNSGDTMSSVMIGGLRTVMNGDFEVFAGDLIQWYWTFERDCFHSDTGRRKSIVGNQGGGPVVIENGDPEVDYGQNPFPAAPNAALVPPNDRLRRIHNDFQYGINPDKFSPADKAKNVARIKPYMPDDVQPRLYDWMRVFAVAISSARPNEMVDIKISKQSL
jgi:hypothetical protein